MGHRGYVCSRCAIRPAELADTGPWVPAWFWEDEALREALAAWHMGHVIEAYRHHPFHGRRPLPQEVVGRWVGVTQAQLSRLENGPPIKDLDKLWLWARTLRIPKHLLWFLLPGEEQRSSGSVLWAADAAGGAASVLMPAVASTGGLVFDPSAPSMWLPDGAAVPAAGELPTSMLAEALMATLRQYVVADNLVGPRPLIPVVSQQLAFLDHLVASSDGPAKTELLWVAARFAEFAGWLHQDGGDLRLALQWSNVSLEFAREAGDPGLVSYIWMRKSNIGSDMGQPQLALAYARAALRGGSNLPPGIRAVALRQAANGHALNRDLDACNRAVDQALASAARVDHNDQTDLARYCTPSYVEMEAAHCWVELGHPGRAVAALHSGLSGWHADFRRDLGLALARLAVAHAANAEPDEAVAVARQSAVIASETRSTRTIRQLDRVPGLLRLAGDGEMADQLGHMLGALHKAAWPVHEPQELW